MTCKPTCACQCKQPGCGCRERERPFVPNRWLRPLQDLRPFIEAMPYPPRDARAQSEES